MYNCAKVIGHNNSNNNRSSSSGLVRDMSSYFSSRKITKMVWSNILREGCQSYVTDGSNFLFAVTHDCECCVPHPKTLNVSKFSNPPHHSNIWLYCKSLSSGKAAVNKKSSRRRAAATSLCCAPSLHCYHWYWLLPKANSVWRDRESSAVKDVASLDANMSTPRCKNLYTGPGATFKSTIAIPTKLIE